jgi:alkaline phosphatase D
MKSIAIIVCVFTTVLACKNNIQTSAHSDQTVIAFGSCGDQDYPQPVLDIAAELKPDAFVFLGDNIYGDTDVMDTLANKYKRWAKRLEYQHLLASTKIFATWDDHDFGRNDSGLHYPYKKQAKEVFMSHFNIDKEHEMRKHEGIYHTNYIKKNDKIVQLIMLDVRYFRNDLLLYDGKSKMPRDHYFYKLDYMPHYSADSTLLGTEQWAWLEKELQKPADVRLICSGSQFSIEFNGYEAWANFPHEQQKLLSLIKSTKANGVLFLTGDVHYAEISKLNEEGLYPIYDVTASGITSTWDFATLNKNRIEGPVMENHFGLLTIDWEQDPKITMKIIDATKNERIAYQISRSEICFRTPNQK